MLPLLHLLVSSSPLPPPVTWTTLLPEPGKNKEGMPTYLNTMPIGNGHVAGNVVMEENVLTILISASSSYGGDGEVLKVALLEVTLAASAYPYGSSFNQTFNPIDGTVTIAVGNGIVVTAYAEARSSNASKASTAASAAPYSDAIVVTVDGDASASAKLLPIRLNACASRGGAVRRAIVAAAVARRARGRPPTHAPFPPSTFLPSHTRSTIKT